MTSDTTTDRRFFHFLLQSQLHINSDRQVYMAGLYRAGADEDCTASELQLQIETVRKAARGHSTEQSFPWGRCGKAGTLIPA